MGSFAEAMPGIAAAAAVASSTVVVLAARSKAMAMKTVEASVDIAAAKTATTMKMPVRGDAAGSVEELVSNDVATEPSMLLEWWEEESTEQKTEEEQLEQPQPRQQQRRQQQNSYSHHHHLLLLVESFLGEHRSKSP